MLKIAFFLEPLENAVRANTNELVGSILGLTESSHEAVFVFDHKNKFQGLVSPYNAFYQKHVPYNMKAGSIISPPPKLLPHLSWITAIKHMLSTRFYTLPVFNHKEEIIGVIRSAHIFAYLLTNNKLLEQVVGKVQVKKPMQVKLEAKVAEAYQLLRQKKISRLVVVGETQQIVGLIARNDLKHAFLAPYSRQRFSKSFGDFGQAAFDDEEIKRSELPIRDFMKHNVLKAATTESIINIVRKLIESKRNSLILTDANNRAVGFISNRDLLYAISNLVAKAAIPVMMERPKQVSQGTILQINYLLQKMGDKLRRRLPIRRFEISFKEGKAGNGTPSFFETTLGAKFYSGDDYVVQTSARKVVISVREALDRVYKLVRRRKKSH